MKISLTAIIVLFLFLCTTHAGLLDALGFGKKAGNAFGSFGRSVLGSESVDVDAYVTNKALDGLFKMVAEEEKRIRENPVARTSDLLQQVFGAVRR